MHIGDQSQARRQKHVERSRCSGHTLEFPRVGLPEIDQVRIEKLMRRTGRTGDIDQKGPEEVLRQAFVFVKERDVVEIPGMLPVQGSVQLASEQILERDDLHFSIAIGFFHSRRDGPDFRVMDDATGDGRGFNLDLGIAEARQQPCGSAAAALDALRFCAADTGFDGSRDAIHRGIDLVQALGAFLDRKVSQVDIYR